MIQNGFWSHDYSSGIEALIKSLELSVAENKQFLAMVRERARIEHSTATSLAQLSQEPVMHAAPAPNGSFVSKSSSLQNALKTFTSETINQAVLHTRIASELDSKVRSPLQKWCNMYAKRVDTCNARLLSLSAGYTRLLQAVNKQKAVYYENCQKYEDSTGGGFRTDSIVNAIRIFRDKLRAVPAPPSGAQGEAVSQSKSDGFTVAGLTYTKREFSELLQLLLADVTLTEYRAPLLGSYKNVTTGSMLATAARKHLRNDSFAYAEKFGQSLVDLGFIKPVGQISNRFQSLHTSYYQWQDSVFALTDHLLSDDSGDDASSSVGSYAELNPPSHPYPNDEGRFSPVSSPRTASLSEFGPGSPTTTATSATAAESSLMATDPSEEHYLQAVLELDKYRCDMEQEIMEIYKFLDKLEYDREDAIKQGMRDFIDVVCRIDEQQDMLLRLENAQRQVDPKKDLESLIARNKTGPYLPTVTVFRGYFDGNVVQTFGVDLAMSKFFVELVLNWLRSPSIENTNQVTLWTHAEPISEVYKLRKQINTGRSFSPESIFGFFPLSVVVSTFRQYLLELPESLVPFIVYERFKQIYSESQPSAGDIALVLVQIPRANREALQQLIEYLRFEFTVSDYADLSAALALPLVRPRAPSALTMDDQHPQRLVFDLLKYGERVFEELDRKQEELKAAKLEHKPQAMRVAAQPECPAPTQPSNRRVESNSGMRPLSMNLGSSRSASLAAASTPLKGEQGSAADDLKSPRHASSSTNSASRGLGISPMLPISADSPRSPFSASSRSFSPPSSSSPASPTPHPRGPHTVSVSSELKSPRVRRENHGQH